MIAMLSLMSWPASRSENLKRRPSASSACAPRSMGGPWSKRRAKSCNRPWRSPMDPRTWERQSERSLRHSAELSCRFRHANRFRNQESNDFLNDHSRYECHLGGDVSIAQPETAGVALRSNGLAVVHDDNQFG